MTTLKSRAYSVVFMFVISAFFAGALSLIKAATADKVADNLKIAGSKNLVEVFELMEDTSTASGEALAEVLSKSVLTFHVMQNGDGVQFEKDPVDSGQPGIYKVWASVDEDGDPVAFAFPIGGKGFWGPIEGLMSVATDGVTIRTVVWTKHGETPGLGARIEEDGYREKFRGKVALDPSDSGNPRFLVVPEGTMQGENQIDGITGATQTTIVGMGNFLPENFETWHKYFPLLEKHFAGDDAEGLGG